jgi:hypothetical protein
MSQQDQSLFPPDTNPVVFEQFSTLNTKPTRNGIKDEEMYWCDGWMPIGPRNLRTLPDVGAALYTAPDGKTIIWYKFGNIAFVEYCIVLLSDGSLVAVNITASTSAQIAPANTINSFVRGNISQIALTQWGAKYIVIVCGQTNGFFVWDGINFFQTGTVGPDVEIFQVGDGYSSQPTITTIGGSGTGVAFTATLFGGAIVGITVTNPGTGYQSTDNVILAFTGGGSAGVTADLQPHVNAGGTITSVSIIHGGAAYQSPVAVVLDSSGIGADLSLTASGGSITAVSIINGGNSYSSSAQILIEDPNSPVAVATVDLMPAGIQGTSAETYTSRLFIGSSALMQISAPGSIVDFSAADGGDEFTSTDSFLRASFTALTQSNGFIYLIADSSVNYISSITTSGSPPATTFTNQNADPQTGTPWSPTVSVFGESVIFANAFGIHLGYGGRFVKISEQLDGIYNTGDNGTSFTPSAAIGTIFGIKVWMLLWNINVPFLAPNTNKLLMTDGKRWWTSSQGIPLIYIAGQEINSELTVYGTDGGAIYPLFQNPSTNFSKTLQSRFWDEPGGYAFSKTVDRVWCAAQWNSLSGSTGLILAADTETAFPSPFITFTPAELGINILPPTALSNWGVLVGMTVITSAADVQLISMTLSVGIDKYRG